MVIIHLKSTRQNNLKAVSFKNLYKTYFDEPKKQYISSQELSKPFEWVSLLKQ